MPSAMQLLEVQCDSRLALAANGFAEHEDRRVSFADFRIDPPGGLGLSIDGLVDIPLVLIEIGNRAGNDERCRFGTIDR